MTRREPPDSGLVDLSKEARIPELQKREEKERKGAGAYWTSGSPGGGGLLARAAAGPGWSPLGFGRLATALGQRVGAGSLAGRVLLSRAGGWLLLGGVLGIGGFVGIAAGLRLAGPRFVEAVARRFDITLPSGLIGPESRTDSLTAVADANRGALGSPRTQAAPADGPAEDVADAPASLPAPAMPGEAPISAEGAADAGGPLVGNTSTARLPDLAASRPVMAGSGPV
ncbi:MAG: hypothetical protein HY553_22755, partial [Elusimicrobia bacterium]|nr:hypothetical protein [Elusimicrobiota bacterium]